MMNRRINYSKLQFGVRVFMAIVFGGVGAGYLLAFFFCREKPHCMDGALLLMALFMFAMGVGLWRNQFWSIYITKLLLILYGLFSVLTIAGLARSEVTIHGEKIVRDWPSVIVVMLGLLLSTACYRILGYRESLGVGRF